MPKIISSHDYNTQAFHPPMPVLDIGVTAPGIDRSAVVLEAIIDTGADGTLIPLDVLESIGAPFVDIAYIRGITGQRESIDIYLVSVYIGPLHVPGVRAAALSANETIILGRDVLNQLQLVLLGPGNSTQVIE